VVPPPRRDRDARGMVNNQRGVRSWPANVRCSPLLSVAMHTKGCEEVRPFFEASRSPKTSLPPVIVTGSGAVSFCISHTSSVLRTRDRRFDTALDRARGIESQRAACKDSRERPRRAHIWPISSGIMAATLTAAGIKCDAAGQAIIAAHRCFYIRVTRRQNRSHPECPASSTAAMVPLIAPVPVGAMHRRPAIRLEQV